MIPKEPAPSGEQNPRPIGRRAFARRIDCADSRDGYGHPRYEAPTRAGSSRDARTASDRDTTD